MPLKTCRKGLHQYDTETAPRIGKSPTCPECLRAAKARYHGSGKGRAALARYLSSQQGQDAVMRYRRSEKGRATWRKQRERRRRIEAEKRAERLRAAGLLPGVKLCRSGLHQYDPATAPKVRGHAICPECRRAARARYKGGASRRAAVARYNLSEKARARQARYRRSEKGRAMQARYRRNRKQRGGPSGTT